jgi:hypothetical protein
MVNEMKCVYCLEEITWSEWLFKGHMNARCEIKQMKLTDFDKEVEEE